MRPHLPARPAGRVHAAALAVAAVPAVAAAVVDAAGGPAGAVTGLLVAAGTVGAASVLSIVLRPWPGDHRPAADRAAPVALLRATVPQPTGQDRAAA